MADLLWAVGRSIGSIFVPVFPGDVIPITTPVREVAVSLLVTTALCFLIGRWLTRQPVLVHLAAPYGPPLRNEAWEEMEKLVVYVGDPSAGAEEGQQQTRRLPARRTGAELLFITAHNGTVTVLAALAWFLGSRALAIHAFTLEVAYEIFDTWNMGVGRMEPETLIHHIVSPICILCSTQTEVDFRVLCHLCICIDLSGAMLGYAKFLLRFGQVSAVEVYRKLTWVYAVLRVVGPLIDTVIILCVEIKSKGGFLNLGRQIDAAGKGYMAKTDWTQMYFWAIAVLNSFNVYFFYVIRARGRMSPQMAAHVERSERGTGCRG